MQECNNPFFVVGSDRSGTTLLRLMLDSHPRLHVPRESWFLIDLLRELPGGVPLDERQRQHAVSLMVGHSRWRDLGIPDADLRDAVASLAIVTLRHLAEAPFRLLMQRAGKARWGDKTPGYVTHISELARLFPEAQFVHLIRDCRDVCVSLRSRGWRGRLPSQARYWATQVAAGMAQGRSLRSGRYLEVSYQDLVLHPETTLEAVCRFLGEDFDPAMLSFHVRAAEAIAPWEADLHAKLSHPPQASEVGRWQREMTSWEVMVVEAIAGSVMDAALQPRRFDGLWRAPVGILGGLLSLKAQVGRSLDRLGIRRPWPSAVP